MAKYGRIAAFCILLLLIIALIIMSSYFGPSQMISDIFTAGHDLFNFIVFDEVFGDHDRSKVSRINSDMRSLATALEAYYIDHKSYPVKIPLLEMSLDPAHIAKIGGSNLFSIEPGKPGKIFGVTTPVAYISSMLKDPFTGKLKLRFYYRGSFFTHSISRRCAPFAYHADANGWILFSPGPDRDYDLTPEKDYDSSIPQPSPFLMIKTYDPTNGTTSDGDIWRVKQ